MQCICCYRRSIPMVKTRFSPAFMAWVGPPKLHICRPNFPMVSQSVSSSIRHFSSKRKSSKKRSFAEEEDSDEFEEAQHCGNNGHVPVLLKEVLQVFDGRPLRSFVDCTVGAGGHASAIIRAHPELQIFIGLDIDPAAHEKAQTQLQAVLNDSQCSVSSDPKLHVLCTNFKDIKCVLEDLDQNLLSDGVDGILMDLGMSSMQVNNAERGFSVLHDGPLDMRMNPMVSLKAEDIINFWPEAEVGRILRDYGEESRWHFLQRKIAEARLAGGIYSTSELVNLIRRSALKCSGRQGWMKTAIRVFQALRIAVNDELRTLESALSDTFTCLASKGRLAVISFHSLEDRIVKQSFLNIIDKDPSTQTAIDTVEHFGHIPGQTRYNKYKQETPSEACSDCLSIELSKCRIEGKYATILTKRPTTPSLEEERFNRRCRSAKLRVLEKK